MSANKRRHFTSREFPRPRILLSQCLELEACRHDGAKIGDPFVRRLLDHVDVVPVCPEVEIGLGIPRPTIRLVDADGATTLRQPSTEADLTARMQRFSSRFLDALGPIDGYILKAGSPSCGTKDVKVYGGLARAPALRKEPGMFAAEVIRRFESFPIEDEGRLRNYPIRAHFLSRLYANADLRQTLAEPSMSALVDFQARYKHVLMTTDQQGARELGQIVANADNLGVAEVADLYARTLRRVLAKPPSRKAHINTLTHMYGHFKKLLPEAEKHEFLRILDEVRDQHLAVVTATTIIRTWSARYEYQYFADQAYLEPYPRELQLMRDSGKGLEF